jgi:multimeric flavodoxin WrbA
MRVMIVNGSPRKGGYTADMIALFRKGVESAGGEVDEILLRTAAIESCVGCFRCWVGNTAGRCIFSDDMDEIIPRYLDSDVLVLATPMYYYSFSALLKMFLERLFPTTQPGLDTGGVLGLGRNRPRYPDKGPKKCILIATCGLRNSKTMHAMVSTFELICDAVSAEPSGVLLRPESNSLDFIEAKPKVLRQVYDAFVKAGVEVVTDGRVSKETERQAGQSFSASEEIFAEHFKNYWAVASEIGPEWTDRKVLAMRATEDPRIIIRELAGNFDPKAAGNREAVIQFVLIDAVHGEWNLAISQGVCTVNEGLHASPNLKLTMSFRTFADISLQKTANRAAFQRGLIEVEGDRRLLTEINRLFPRTSG